MPFKNGEDAIILKIFISELIALGSLVLSARITYSVPFSPVPFTAQTIAVLAIPFFLPGLQALFPILIYLILALLGLPLLADGKGGFDVFFGPSIGFLLGFIIATLNQIYWVNKIGNGFLLIFFLNIVGHLIILFSGLIGLFFLDRKVELLIFLPMVILKSILISGLILAIRKIT